MRPSLIPELLYPSLSPKSLALLMALWTNSSLCRESAHSAWSSKTLSPFIAKNMQCSTGFHESTHVAIPGISWNCPIAAHEGNFYRSFPSKVHIYSKGSDMEARLEALMKYKRKEMHFSFPVSKCSATEISMLYRYLLDCACDISSKKSHRPPFTIPVHCSCWVLKGKCERGVFLIF